MRGISHGTPELVSTGSSRLVMNGAPYCRNGGNVLTSSRELRQRRAADNKLGKILRIVEPVRAEAPLIVTSDHGEQFGENGLVEHHIGVGNALLHVPLIVNGLPGVQPARIRTPVQLADVMPSILAWARAPTPIGLIGRPLPRRDPSRSTPRILVADSPDPFSLWRDLPDEWRTAAEAQLDHCGESDRVRGKMRAVTRFPYKLRLYEEYTPQLFDLAADPYEEHDLSAAKPGVVARLESGHDLALANATTYGGGAPIELSPAEVERLRALGYLGGNAVAEPTDGPAETSGPDEATDEG